MFAEMIKNQTLKGIRRIKMTFCRIVHNIRLYKILFLLPLLKNFGCYGSFKFPQSILLLFDCRYFDECLLNGPLPNIYTFCPNLSILIGCHGNQNAKFANNIQNSTNQKLYGDKAKPLQNCS